MTKKTPKAPNFEKSLDELTALVEKLEEGGLSLEDSLKHFEKGIKLTRKCQKALTEAEQQVSILTSSDDDEFNTRPFAPDEE